MSHMQILTCPVQTILKTLTETQNLYSQLITLFKMSSQDIYNIYIWNQPRYWETDILTTLIYIVK